MTEYPERLQIETFLGCNARCTMCSVQRWRRSHGEMSSYIFEKAVQESKVFLPQLQVVSLTMDGEPLMGKKIVKRISFCKRFNFPKVGFATNGSLLKKNLGNKLLDAGLDWISFSFDCLDKSVYERNRIRLDYNVTLNNIHTFISERNRGSYSTKINLRYLDHQNDYEIFKEYRSYWNGFLRDGDQIHYGRVYDWYSNDTGTENDPLSCSYAINNIVILKDGEIPLCCKDFNATFLHGNISETSLIDIWNSARWKKVRNLHRALRGNAISFCRGCDLPDYERGRQLLANASSR